MSNELIPEEETYVVKALTEVLSQLRELKIDLSKLNADQRKFNTKLSGLPGKLAALDCFHKGVIAYCAPAYPSMNYGHRLSAGEYAAFSAVPDRRGEGPYRAVYGNATYFTYSRPTLSD